MPLDPVGRNLEAGDSALLVVNPIEAPMDMVASLCQRVYVIAEGLNLTAGTFNEVVADQRVVRAYLGGMA